MKRSDEELYLIFKGMFPNFGDRVKAYKRIGSCTIAVDLDDNKSYVFLYISPDNFSFGTKLWRKRPDLVTKKVQKMREENENVINQ